MRKLSLANLEAGMILAKDSTDRTGRVLLREGMALETKHLRVFKTWGVTHVYVEGPEEDEAAPPPVALGPEQYRVIKQQADNRFRHTDSKHPVMRILKARWMQRLVHEHAKP